MQFQIQGIHHVAWQTGDIATAQGSMHYLAFTVPFTEEAYCKQFVARGIVLTPVLNHKSECFGQQTESDNPPAVSSFCCFDPQRHPARVHNQYL